MIRRFVLFVVGAVTHPRATTLFTTAALLRWASRRSAAAGLLLLALADDLESRV